MEVENHEIAEKLLEEALEMAQTYHSEDSDISFDLVETIAMLVASRGRLKQARSLLEENFAKSAVLRGSKNPKTLQIAHNLAWVLEEEGKADIADSK